MSSSMTGATGFGRATSTGTLKRGGMQGDYIPKGTRAAQLQNYTPEQMQLFKQAFSHVGPDSYLSKLAGGDQGMFEEMEAPAKRQFSGLQGGMASKFSGMGGTGARKSSGFQNEMTAANSNFAQDLQSRRQGLQQQAIHELMGLSHSLLNERPYEREIYKKDQQKPWWQGALGAISPIGGDIAQGGTQNTQNFFSALSGMGGGGQGGSSWGGFFGNKG